jgi:hypothetical protein
MEQVITREQNRGRLLLIIGCLWILLAAGYSYYQFTNHVVAIQWNTDTEINTAGFNIYRSTSPDGDFVRINEEVGLIASEGSAFTGAVYEFYDPNVEVNTTYYYLLEEIEYNQTINRHYDDILTHHVPYATTADALIMAFMIFCGLGLIITGFREDKIV